LSLLLDPNRRKDQGCGGYVAPDCKASKARMAAAPLPPHAWLKQAERFYSCFAARCSRILQGRSANAQTIWAVLPKRGFAMLSTHKPFRSTKMA